MILTSSDSYTCTQTISAAQAVSAPTVFDDEDRASLVNEENRSLISSASSTSSSYSAASMTSDFSSSTISSKDEDEEDLCSNFTDINLNKQASCTKEPLKNQILSSPPVNETNSKTTINSNDAQSSSTSSHGTISPVEANSYVRLYKIQEKIRSGGFGVVFKGVRRFDNLPIAIKIIRKDKITLWTHVSCFFLSYIDK